jgi:BMFP domain-containing protein YqiC
MSRNSDLRSTFKSFTENLASGNKSAADVADSLNTWLKEGGEALRVKIEDEVERSVSKMGFIKRGEFEALRQQVAELASADNLRPTTQTSIRTARKTGSKPKKTSGVKKVSTAKASPSRTSSTVKSSQVKKQSASTKRKQK